MIAEKQLSAEASFLETRQHILNDLLIGASILATLQLAKLLVKAAFTAEVNFLAIFAAFGISIWLLIIATKRTWSYTWRAVTFLLIVYLVSLQITMVEGVISGSGRLALTAFVILTMTLFDIRSSAITVVMVLVTIWVIGLSTPVSQSNQFVDYYMSPSGFYILVVYYALVGSIAVLTIGRLLNSVKNTIRKDQKLAVELEAEGKILEGRILAREEALKTSTEINLQISGLLNSEEIVQTALRLTYAKIACVDVQFYMFERFTGNLILQAAASPEGQQLVEKGYTLQTGFNLIGEVAAQQQIQHARPNPPLPHHLLQTMSETALPIVFENILYGVFAIQSKSIEPPKEDVQYALEIIVEQIAVTLHNAHLYDRAQKLLTREAITNHINQKLQMGKDMETVLRIAAEELGKAINVEQVNIVIGREE